MNNGHLVGFMKDSGGGGLPSPILEYTFNASDFADTSGNGYTGTGYNSPTFVTGKNGGAEKSCSLDGVNQYFGMPTNVAWEELSGKDFTSATWIKVAAGGTINGSQYIGNLSDHTRLRAQI